MIENSLQRSSVEMPIAEVQAEHARLTESINNMQSVVDATKNRAVPVVNEPEIDISLTHSLSDK